MRKVLTTTHIYCDFCGEECIHKSSNDEWGCIWLTVEGRDYAGNAGGAKLLTNADVCRDCLKKIRDMIKPNLDETRND